jgi:hypothetical protein
MTARCQFARDFTQRFLSLAELLGQADDVGAKLRVRLAAAHLAFDLARAPKPGDKAGLFILRERTCYLTHGSPKPDTAVPYVMWPDTHYEHLMIPVRYAVRELCMRQRSVDR